MDEPAAGQTPAQVVARASMASVYQASVWAQACLPYRDPGPGKVWYRLNNGGKLTLTPGEDRVDLASLRTGTRTGAVGALPYGVIARKVLIYFATELRRTGDRAIVLPGSLREFLTDVLGVQYGGRNAALVKEQLRRIEAMSMSLLQEGPDEGSTTRLYWRVVEAAHSAGAFGLADTNRDSGAATIILDERYAEHVLASSIPLDQAMLEHLNEAMALDIYLWLTYRRAAGRDVRVSWDDLMLQFGSATTAVIEFRRLFRKHLVKIQAAWPELDVETDRRGVTIARGPAHVAQRRRKHLPAA